ncbi:MAG: EAL domain-containing protein [Pseudomonadota bacterium]
MSRSLPLQATEESRHRTPGPYSGGVPTRANRAFEIARRLATPIWVYDIDMCRVVLANEAGCAIWDADNETTLRNRDLAKDMSSTVAKRLKQYQSDFSAHNATFSEMWTLYPGGQPRSVQVLFSGFVLDDGRMAMLCEAVGQPKDEPDTLRSAEALLHTDVMIALYDLDGPPLYMNPAARNAVVDIEQPLSALMARRSDFEMVIHNLDRSGEVRIVTEVNTITGTRWFDLSAKLCSDAATGIPAVLLTSTDVSELKNARDQARYLADRDLLTGCYNRSYLQNHISELRDSAKAPCALVYFDIDNFKSINDRFGHEAGDAVLKRIIERTQGVIRQEDVIARLGGDEFVIIFEDVPTIDAFEAKIKAVHTAVCGVISYQSTRMNVTVSAGCTYFTPEDADFTTILRQADIALYSAKQSGRNRVVAFNEELGAAAEKRTRFEEELKSAIEKREFHMHFQPRLDLASGRVVSAEALARWQHPRRGLVMPADFIPICEDTGMIEELGRMALELGSAELLNWTEAGLDLDVSVNVSPRQFDDERFIPFLEEQAKAENFPRGRVELEVTESVLIGDKDTIARKLSDITAMGYRIALDDFGTGYSNLAYISHFPLNCIKIDASFVRQLPESGPIVRLILTLSKQIGALSVAEGIETEAQLAWLVENGCDQGQGFLMSKPLPAAELIKALAGVEATAASAMGKTKEPTGKTATAP